MNAIQAGPECFCQRMAILESRPHDEPIDFGLLTRCFENSPAWYNHAREHQYRKGFFYGVIEAMRMVRRLHASGFARTTEIANIIDEFRESKLRPWKRVIEPRRCEEPALNQASWYAIRRQVISRDGGCVDCRSTQQLEAHHIVAVKDGGLPNPENLVTLCKRCHSLTTANLT